MIWYRKDWFTSWSGTWDWMLMKGHQPIAKRGRLRIVAPCREGLATNLSPAPNASTRSASGLRRR